MLREGDDRWKVSKIVATGLTAARLSKQKAKEAHNKVVIIRKNRYARKV